MFLKHTTACGVALFFVVGCCDYIKSEANELKSKHQKCDPGDTCIFVNFFEEVGDPNCLEAFQCSSSMNEKNIDEFVKEARRLAQRYERCNECVTAGCAGTEGYEAVCNETTGMCDWSEL